MKRTLSAVLIASTFAAPALAADCRVLYDNRAEVRVKDNAGSSAALFLFGAAAALIADASSKSNNSETELFLKDRVQKVDTFKILNSTYSNSRLLQADTDNSNGCVITLTLSEIILNYGGNGTDSVFKFQVKKSVNGQAVIDKNDNFSFAVPGSPIPKQPRRKFERARGGKWIEVTKPAPSKEEAYDAFEPGYISSIGKMFSKAVKKYSK